MACPFSKTEGFVALFYALFGVCVPYNLQASQNLGNEALEGATNHLVFEKGHANRFFPSNRRMCEKNHGSFRGDVSR